MTSTGTHPRSGEFACLSSKASTTVRVVRKSSRQAAMQVTTSTIANCSSTETTNKNPQTKKPVIPGYGKLTACQPATSFCGPRYHVDRTGKYAECYDDASVASDSDHRFSQPRTDLK